MLDNRHTITLQDDNPGPVEIVVSLTEHVKNVFIVASCQDILMESGCLIQGHLNTKSTSGDIRLNNVTAQTITLTSQSGTIRATSLKDVRYLRLSTVSGHVGVASTNVQILQIRNSSGNIKTIGANSKVLDVVNNSGKIDLYVSNTFFSLYFFYS